MTAFTRHRHRAVAVAHALDADFAADQVMIGLELFLTTVRDDAGRRQAYDDAYLPLSKNRFRRTKR